MKKITESNLRTAFAGESQAHMKYMIFADRAEREGLSNVARLFRAVAYAERVHATNHFVTLGDLGTTEKNLQTAIDGETYEVEEMYPSYKAVSELQKEKGAQRSIHYALEAEKVHNAMFQKAQIAVQGRKDIELKQVQICTVCGYTIEGEAPDKCPICGASKDRFRSF